MIHSITPTMDQNVVGVYHLTSSAFILTCPSERSTSKDARTTIRSARRYFLAVQNSSIGDLVTHSLTDSLTDSLRTLLIVIQKTI